MINCFLASNNKNKVAEFSRMLTSVNLNILTADFVSPEENGTTFEQNALIKAQALQKKVKAPVLADDSGLEVDFLDKKPGILSARYLGEDKSDKERCLGILSELDGVEEIKRTARFVCALCYIDQNSDIIIVRGTVEGKIATKMYGENGFGYDPIFLYEGKSLASISGQEKDKISHRHNALVKLIDLINKS